MAEVVEHPPQARGDPAADVVVGDDEVLVADPGRLERAARTRRGRGGDGGPGRRAGGIGEVAVDIEEDGARDVARRRRPRGPSPGLPRNQRTSTIAETRVVEPVGEGLRRR